MKQKTNVTPLQRKEALEKKDDRSVVSSLTPREKIGRAHV